MADVFLLFNGHCVYEPEILLGVFDDLQKAINSAEARGYGNRIECWTPNEPQPRMEWVCFANGNWEKIS